MPDRLWHRIAAAPRGAGPLLLRVSPSSNDGVFIGYQADDGRWMIDPMIEARPQPLYFGRIPEFDAEEADGSVA